MELLGSIKEKLRRPEETKNTYSHLFPIGTVIRRIEEEGPSHTGPFKGALDFIVDLDTPILAPLDGIIETIIDTNDRFGPTPEFKDFLNYITIRHTNGEYSQPAHLAKGSALVKQGEIVKAGQQIGVTGQSGWMTEPHLHFFVFKSTPKEPGFIGLKIRFDK